MSRIRGRIVTGGAPCIVVVEKICREASVFSGPGGGEAGGGFLVADSVLWTAASLIAGSEPNWSRDCDQAVRALGPERPWR